MSGNLPDYTDLVRWTINDVGQWLSANAFSEFCRSFREAGIDGVKFVDLDDTQLARMRTPMNKRSKLMAIIKRIKKPDLSAVQNIINRTPASPRILTRDYNQKAPPPTPKDSGIDDSGSGTESDDDYEWAPSDFEEDDPDDRGHVGADDNDEDYDQPDAKLPPPRVGRGGRAAPSVPVQSQPMLPSRPGRRTQPTPTPAAAPHPKEEEQPTYEETDVTDLAPEQVYEDPDNPVVPPQPPPQPPSQPPPPPRGGRHHKSQPPAQVSRRPPARPVEELEQEEVYAEPDLPEAPKPPVVEQPAYEEMAEPEIPSRNNRPSRPQPANETTHPHPKRGRHQLPPIPSKAPANSDSDKEDYEEPNEPTGPIPRAVRQQSKTPKQPTHMQDQPGYMEMASTDSSTNNHLTEDDQDIYVVPEEEEEQVKPVKSSPAKRSGARDPPRPVPGAAPQFKLPIPARQQEPLPAPGRKELLSPATEKSSRSLPPPPRSGARPLPTVPTNNNKGDVEENTVEDLTLYDWYRGNMTRTVGDTKLKQHRKNGMYAIRDSSNKGGKQADGDPRPYTLMIFNDNKVYNLPIRKRLSDGHYAMGNPKPKEETFSKLVDLVTFFSKRMIMLAGSGSGQTHLKLPIPL